MHTTKLDIFIDSIISIVTTTCIIDTLKPLFSQYSDAVKRRDPAGVSDAELVELLFAITSEHADEVTQVGNLVKERLADYINNLTVAQLETLLSRSVSELVAAQDRTTADIVRITHEVTAAEYAKRLPLWLSARK